MRSVRAVPRVLAIASHPIQYHAPWFRMLAARTDVHFEALFIESPDPVRQGRGFGVAFEWDVPLLEGYRSTTATDSLLPLASEGFFRFWLARPGRLLRERSPDVVVMTGWHVAPLVQLMHAACRAGVPVIMRAEANALRPRPLPARLWHRWLLSQCKGFMPIGRANREFYASQGIEADRMTDAPYFVDNERFFTAARSISAQRLHLRRRWQIPEDAVCFLFAGKLEPKKRVLDLLSAMQAAMERTTLKLHLLVVGDGEQMAQARQQVDARSLPVTFAGFLNQTEIPAAYAASDALVLPSDFGETWGLVVNEAMACGLPAIVSDRVGCASDLVHDGETGYRFPFADTSALADRMVMMAAHKDRRAAMGERARALVHRDYTVARCTESTVRSVQRVLGLA